MVNADILLRAYRLMCTARAMSGIYESNRSICKYVHSTSGGHEAIQLATAFHLLSCDFVSPYYRDESMLLGLGFTPFELMLQLLAKAGNNSFAEALAGRISRNCWSWLDAPVAVIGALNLPAVPMNMLLEKAMLPGPEKVAAAIGELLGSCWEAEWW